MVEDEHLNHAAEALANARHVAVLTGAGISKESGIPTFREAQTGLWARYDPQQLATPDAFRRNPDLVWSWYQFRVDLVAKASPNPGHVALADLEQLVGQVAILTQNVDGLHARVGSRDVVELHGSLQRFRCASNCQGSPTIVDLQSIPYDREHAPRCPHCGAFVRPGVVWYGENLPADALRRAFREARLCDVMLVVGTSGVVVPAATLPGTARQRGATVIEVNPEETPITPVAHIFLRGASGQVLPRLVDQVKAIQRHMPIT